MRHHIRRAFTMVVIGALGISGLALNAQAVGRIQGVVRDGANQRPIARAYLSIQGTTIHAFTGADGAYLLDSIPAGLVSVKALSPGRRPREVDGLRIRAGQTMVQDFSLDASPVTLRPVTSAPPGLVLRFQLIRPIATRTVDKSIMPIDSALRDLFQWQGYELLSQAAITTDIPTPPEWGGSGARAFTQTELNVDGRVYELGVEIDTVVPPQVKMTVSLVSLGQTASGAGQSAAATGRKTLLATTVTVGFGRTVILGSTQPGGGRGGMSGTMILAVRPVLQPSIGTDTRPKNSPDP